MSAENSDKTPMRPGGRGGSLLTGNPGNKGGRPKNEWKEACRAVIDQSSLLEIASDILADPKHPQWAFVVKWFGEQAYGKPTEDANVNLATKTYMVVREGEDWTEGV